MFHRTNGARRGRDGCRVPLPWSAAHDFFGFSLDGTPGTTWLPRRRLRVRRQLLVATGLQPGRRRPADRHRHRIRREDPRELGRLVPAGGRGVTASMWILMIVTGVVAMLMVRDVARDLRDR